MVIYRAVTIREKSFNNKERIINFWIKEKLILWICRRSFSAGDLKGRRMENAANSFGSILVIFCYKPFEKFALYKSVSQSEATCIVYSEPIESKHVQLFFPNRNTSKM